jgi:O-antigen/teichoic acid export membrane protein
MARTTESVLRHHWSAFFSGGLLSLTRLLTGFVRIKYVALVLGTAGVGFLSQATQLQLLGISVASLSLAVGIINRMGAIGPQNRVREARLLSTAFTSQIAISAMLLVLAAVAPGSLTAAVFGDRTLAAGISPYDVLAVVFSVPLSVVASGYLEAIFFGGGRYDLYVKASIWATVLGFASTLTMIWIWRLPGAFWSIVASSAMLMTSFLVFVRRLRPLPHLFRFGFDLSEANALVRFSIAVLVSGALVPAARLLIQRDVIIRYGPDANGLLQVPLAITAYYTPFLTSPLWGRLHPRITHVGAGPEGRHELNMALRFTASLATAAIAAILLLKDVLVPLAYSRAFQPATRLLPVELVGDYFYFIVLTFSVYALGLSRLRIYLAGWIAYSVVALLGSLYLVRHIEIIGVPIGYGLSAAMCAVIALAWFVSEPDEDTMKTCLFIVAGLVVVSIQALLAWYGRLVILQGAIVVVTSAAALAGLWRARASGAEAASSEAH